MNSGSSFLMARVKGTPAKADKGEAKKPAKIDRPSKGPVYYHLPPKDWDVKWEWEDEEGFHYVQYVKHTEEDKRIWGVWRKGF